MKAETQMITKDTTIGDVVEKYPEVVDTLTDLGVHCVGCHVSPYESIEMGFKGHGMSDEQVEEAVTQLNLVIDRSNVNNTETILLTESAVSKIKDLLTKEESIALRIKIKPGGCSGFEYIFSVATEKQEDDIIIESKGAVVFVDKLTMQKIGGSEIEFKDTLQDAGFKVQNPKAESTCGCGSSFS